jgi:hypothetical protein
LAASSTSPTPASDGVLPLEVGDNVEPTAEPIVNPTESVATPGSVTNNKNIEWSLLAKKIERRLKGGRDPKTSFDSAHLTADEIDAVMHQCYKGMTVEEVHNIIVEVKAPTDDMTPEERRLYNRIVAQMNKRGQEWASAVARGDVVDPTLDDIIRPSLQVELGRTMTTGMTNLGVRYGPQMDPGRIGEVTQDWLSEYVPDRSKEIDATSRRILESVVAQYRVTPSMTKQDIADALSGSYDKSRAQSIAITETTRAASQAVASYQNHLGNLGFRTERFWTTDNDDLVCATCGPLHNKSEDVWLADYPEGPPAHPRCRCATSIRIYKGD